MGAQISRSSGCGWWVVQDGWHGCWRQEQCSLSREGTGACRPPPTCAAPVQEAGHGGERAFIFEGNEPGRQAEATYEQALHEVCRLVSGRCEAAQAGRAQGRVCGSVAARLACARLPLPTPPGLDAAAAVTHLPPPALPCPALCQANWLREAGVGKGDYVAIYMPMVLELPYAMVGS